MTSLPQDFKILLTMMIIKKSKGNGTPSVLVVVKKALMKSPMMMELRNEGRVWRSMDADLKNLIGT